MLVNIRRRNGDRVAGGPPSGVDMVRRGLSRFLCLGNRETPSFEGVCVLPTSYASPAVLAVRLIVGVASVPSLLCRQARLWRGKDSVVVGDRAGSGSSSIGGPTLAKREGGDAMILP